MFKAILGPNNQNDCIVFSLGKLVRKHYIFYETVPAVVQIIQCKCIFALNFDSVRFSDPQPASIT